MMAVGREINIMPTLYTKVPMTPAAGAWYVPCCGLAVSMRKIRSRVTNRVLRNVGTVRNASQITI